MTTDALLGLGSNLGDPLGNLRRAVRSVEAVGAVVRRSSTYRSAPVGYQDQPDFLNAALHIRTATEPDALLRTLKSIEKEAGRLESFRNAPRTLDIDILFFGDRIVRRDGLRIPHPRWWDRSFVLAPLAEIAPDWRDPETGRRVEDVWEDSRSRLPPVHLHGSLDPDGIPL